MDSIGLRFNTADVIWDAYNPHPDLGALPPEVVFIGKGNESATEAFNSRHPASAGLQELVTMYPGYVFSSRSNPYQMEPLLRTGRISGVVNWYQLVQRSFFGMRLNPNPRRGQSPESYILAAHIHGDYERPADTSEAFRLSDRAPDSMVVEKLNAIVIADVDLISEQFFLLRERGGQTGFNFDNITFALNCMDILAGDSSFIDLRKKRVKHRTLEKVEARTREFVERRLEEESAAEERAETALAEAQGRLDAKVAEVRNRDDLDEQTVQIMVRNVQEVESRRFEVEKANIESQKEASIQASKEKMEIAIRGIQSRIKTLAILLPPIPVLAIGLVTFIRRRRREREGAQVARRLRS